MTGYEKAQRHLRNAMNALYALGADDLGDMAHAMFKELATRTSGQGETRVTTLADREVAVLIDSLAIVRNQLREAGYTGNDNQSGLDKINSLMAPDVSGLYVTSRKS